MTTNIWKFQVRGRISINEQINNWSLQGSNDGLIWTNLYSSTTIILQTVVEVVLSPTPTIAYLYYRVYSTTYIAGPNPGLSWFQLS